MSCKAPLYFIMEPPDMAMTVIEKAFIYVHYDYYTCIYPASFPLIPLASD